LQLAYFLGRAGIEYILVERAPSAGSFFERFPIHRTLLSINKVNTGFTDATKNLRWDWNSLLSDDPALRFSEHDGSFFPAADSLVRHLREFCSRAGINPLFNCNVSDIAKVRDQFQLTTQQGMLRCDFLVMATGTSLPYIPAIDGAELAETYFDLDPTQESVNKDILIVGKGNAALETAWALLPDAAYIHVISPKVLKMAWRSHFPGDVRQVNSPFVETFFLKQQGAVLNGTICKIERSGQRFQVTIRWSENAAVVTHIYDRVILCTGFRFDTSVFEPHSTPKLMDNGKLPDLTPSWESVNIPGLFFCGALMQANGYKKSAAPFVHGIRYNCLTLSRLLSSRVTGCDYPWTTVESTAGALFARIDERVRVASSIWNMYDSLCDAFIYSPESETFRHLEDVPIEILSLSPQYKSTCRIELRFTYTRPEDPTERIKFTPSGLLHPALVFFCAGRFVGECHMYEDVYAEWKAADGLRGKFTEALADYLEKLGAPTTDLLEVRASIAPVSGDLSAA